MNYAEDCPPVETECLECGSVLVRVGNQLGIVSSFHLVEPKANQLKLAWLFEHRFGD